MEAQFCRCRTLVGLLLVAATLVAGCSEQIEILQYPEFYDPDDPAKNIKSIVVLPFRNQTGKSTATSAGVAIGEELSGMLGGSGTYQHVYNRSNLKELMNEQDLRIALGGDANALANALKKLGRVEAMITGAVTSYDSGTKTETKMVPQTVGYHPKTKMPITRLVPMQVTTNESTVTLTASMIRIRDAETIHPTGPISRRYTSGSVSQAECLRLARSAAVAAAKGHFTVVRKTVTVDSDAFRVARSYYDGQWAEEDEFRPTEDKAYVVLKLPPQCDRNRFRITIVRLDQMTDLFVQKVRWVKASQPVHPGGQSVNPGKIGIGFEFSPKKIAEKGGGPGTYMAKFYAGPQPALTVEFDIESDH